MVSDRGCGSSEAGKPPGSAANVVPAGSRGRGSCPTSGRARRCRSWWRRPRAAARPTRRRGLVARSSISRSPRWTCPSSAPPRLPEAGPGRARACGPSRGGSAAASRRSRRSRDGAAPSRGTASRRRRVLEQAAGVAVVAVGAAAAARARAAATVVRRTARPTRPAGCATRRRGNSRSRRARRRRGAAPASAPRVGVRRGLDGAHLQLQPAAEALDRPSTRTASPSANRPSSSSTSLQTRASILPLGRRARARGRVRRPSSAAALAPTAKTPSTVLSSASSAIASRPQSMPTRCTLGRGRSSPVSARPLRSPEPPARDAPPVRRAHPAQRLEYLAASPHNVVHLTLPTRGGGGRAVRALARGGRPRARRRAASGPRAGLRRPRRRRRTREGLVASLRAEPYDDGLVLPHERTHAGPKEGGYGCCGPRARSSSRSSSSMTGLAPYDQPSRPPGPRGRGNRLWRLESTTAFRTSFADRSC
jgi:hypothetical protein